MPRLVILANYGAPYAGTFAAMVRALGREARRRGWEAEVVLCAAARGRAWPAELALDGLPYRFAPDGSMLATQRWLEAGVLAGAGPIVLDTHFTRFDVPAALAARRRPNVAVFWHVHSNLPRRSSGVLRNCVKYALPGRTVDRIVCVAPDIARAVARRGARAGRVAYVPNAIDTRGFALTDASTRRAARLHLGLPLDAPILLHFGWDWPRKGGPLFVRTVGALVSAGLRVLGVTVGGGAAARAAVAASELPAAVRILEPRGDVAALYAAADVLVAPSLAEGMPFAMSEALCTGLAVVGSTVPGHVAIAGGLKACRLTALEPAGLAAAVRAVLARDPAEAEEEGRAAREQMVRRFDLEPWSRRMIDLFAQAPACRRRLA